MKSIIKFFYTVLLCYYPSIIFSQINTNDSLALVQLYHSTNGDNWNNNNNWLTGNVDSWYGIYVIDNRVKQINLLANNLVGEIPEEITNLVEITNITLDQNTLSGIIPSSINKLTQLEILSLQRNQISGEIPSSIGDCTELVVLSLGNNELTSSIPQTIGKLNKLTSLGLEVNQLNGSLPEEIGNLINLQFFNCGVNNLSGTIPELFANLTELKSFSLPSNNLEGNVPIWLADLTKLEIIDLNSNQFTGTIPSELGNLSSLKNLSIQNNLLTGSIPQNIFQLTALRKLDLSSNQLIGSIAAEWNNLINLETLSLRGNQFDGEIPIQIGNLTNLRFIDIALNNFEGALPESFTGLLNLKTLDIQDNEINYLPDLSNLPLNYFTVVNNRLQFSSLEKNIDLTISYVPQKPYTLDSTITLQWGDDITLLSELTGTLNNYQWYLESIPIKGADSASLNLKSITETNLGNYRCEISNPNIPDLILSTGLITIEIDNFIPRNLSLTNNQIAENSTIGQHIGDLIAEDIDIANGDSLIFSLPIGEADNSLFEITERGLTALFKPNFEEKSVFEIMVKVKDRIGAEISENFAIEVTNINETPYISDTLFTVLENTSNGTFIGQLIANDEDEDTINFKIISGNSSNTFSIINGDSLIVNDEENLDFELIKSFSLEIESNDGELSDTAFITIELLDITDEIITKSKDRLNNNLFNIYPNPASNQINILIGNMISETGKLYIYDNYGKLLIEREIIENTIIDINNLKSGLYHATIEIDGFYKHKNFVKL
ncbi:cadherin domain-containing protein [Marivirga arenosa]|uniref:Cadherin domain-containing protein n=1 Tax=Marivirga arenosa TaxID=3059076 RepID=A0AA51X456_9BACT|nr:cadherin domain-containing protein [Marivirga sp. BKB1-2]WNB17222.1 cadherin domain-containing protein [Marivirga sp. BKB1-2]